jgi:hypothetical protein
VERYWRRGLLTDRQYAAAVELIKANRQASSGYALSTMRPRVDGGQALDMESKVDAQARFKALSQDILAEYWPYVRHVVIENRSLWCFQGCSGGANLNRYLKRLRKGLGGIG